MEFIPIDQFNDYRSEKIYRSYTQSFPPEERRDETLFQALFHNPNVKILYVVHQNEEIGYLITWHISDFVFVEHFEVFPEFRSKKYGSAIIQHLQEVYTKVILESEPSFFSEIANRRIGFYQRNGFIIIDETYIQPSLGPGKSPVQLFLMSNFQPESVEKLVEDILRVVYDF